MISKNITWCGQILAEMAEHGERSNGGNPNNAGGVIVTLSDVGLTAGA
jgi:hypothetical protein